MIDIDFTNNVDLVRAKIGDPNTEYVTDATINSALTKYGNNVITASIVVMELLLNAFATLADREREGQVEVYYTYLYERYKDRYEDLKRQQGYKKAIPIIIGGTSLQKRNEIFCDEDMFTGYLQSDWHDIMLANNHLYEQVLDRDYS